jgi:hypothetical protein
VICQKKWSHVITLCKAVNPVIRFKYRRARTDAYRGDSIYLVARRNLLVVVGKIVGKNTQEQQKANQVIRIFQIACGLRHVPLTSLSICVCY